MADGKLGSADLAATTNTVVYTPPSGKFACVSVNICNRNSTNAKVRLALSSSGTSTPAASEWIEYDRLVANGLPVERTGLILNYGDRLIVYSDSANVSVMVDGFEAVP